MAKSRVTNSTIRLIVEKKDNDLWGRVKVKRTLIVDTAESLPKLQEQMKVLTSEELKTEVVAFEISYDLTSFFEEYDYLNVAAIAKEAGISHGLMRQYAIGAKFPSEERVKQIEGAIHRIGQKLARVRLHKPSRKARTAA